MPQARAISINFFGRELQRAAKVRGVNIPLVVAKRCVTAMFTDIAQLIRTGEIVKLSGIGTFRQIRKPLPNKPSHARITRIKFTPAKNLLNKLEAQVIENRFKGLGLEKWKTKTTITITELTHTQLAEFAKNPSGRTIDKRIVPLAPTPEFIPSYRAPLRPKGKPQKKKGGRQRIHPKPGDGTRKTRFIVSHHPTWERDKDGKLYRIGSTPKKKK